MKKIIKTLKGKWPEYLLETFVIVVSIFGGLELENWNEERKEEKLELKALIALKNEFKVNKDRIEDKQNLRISIQKPINQYLNKISNGNVTFEDFKSFQLEYIFTGLTNPTFGVVSYLISSGDIRLITNDKLKYLLTEWKDLVGNLLENEQILWEVTLQINEYRMRRIPEPSYKWIDWPKDKLEDNFKKILHDTEYRNRIVDLENSIIHTITACDEVQENLEKIIGLIDLEIIKNE